MAEKWQEISTAKRATLLSSIPSEWLIPDDKVPDDSVLDISDFPEKSAWFTERELEITSKSAKELLRNLSSAQWTSEEVTKAFCKRAAAAHQLTNCLAETMFDSALSSARQLDDHLKRTGSPKGPLHGLPISIKDNFNVIGKDSTLGFTSWVNDPAKYNSVLVEILESAGAVLYVKTNVPTAMMIAETVNNVFGRTLNPRNRALTPGGSSGGESALIAFGGSPLGVGTDIGGSLRIPAACTGLFTLRPSFGRFPTLLCRSALAGQEAVQSVNGPLGTSVQDLSIYCRAIIDAHPWIHDPRCLPIPWRGVEKKTKLKIGVMWHDGVVRPTPPVTRALEETITKLRAAGHEIVDWEPTGHQAALLMTNQMFTADGGKSVRKILEATGEPFRPEMDYYGTALERGSYYMWQLQIERTEFCKAYLDRWNTHGLDGLICPTTPYASVEHGKFGYVGYTCVFNILDYSAVSFPTGVKADKNIDTTNDDLEPLTEFCTTVQASYNPNVVHEMPVSLQLVARRLEEEKVLAMTETILEAL